MWYSGGYTINGEPSYWHVHTKYTITLCKPTLVTMFQIYYVVQILNTGTILNPVVTSHTNTFTHSYYHWRSRMQRYAVFDWFAVLHLDCTKALQISHPMLISHAVYRWVWFRCVWFNVMCMGLNQSPIVAFFPGVVDEKANIPHWTLWNHWSQCTCLIISCNTISLSLLSIQIMDDITPEFFHCMPLSVIE